jgi:methionyl-tRNA formyltransferase
MRIVAMNSFLPGYRLVADWAERNGHEIVLVVTPPLGANQRYDAGANPLVLDLPSQSSALVTGKLRSVAAPVIASMQPDLVISAAFPRLIPPEVLAIPKYGAINLHPSPLPAGRGPNPIRLVYEGATTIGATVHRTAEAFDTGAILARRERPLPDPLTGPALFAAWGEMLAEALEEGAARAIAGEPGIPQDPALASEAPPFTEAEQLLDLTEPVATIRRKAAALNITEPRARIALQGISATVLDLYDAPSGAGAVPGTVLAEHPDGWTIQAADAAVRLVTR